MAASANQGAIATGTERALTQTAQDFLFDTHGYRILRGVLSAEELHGINAFADQHDTPDRKVCDPATIAREFPTNGWLNDE